MHSKPYHHTMFNGTCHIGYRALMAPSLLSGATGGSDANVASRNMCMYYVDHKYIHVYIYIYMSYIYIYIYICISISLHIYIYIYIFIYLFYSVTNSIHSINNMILYKVTGINHMSTCIIFLKHTPLSRHSALLEIMAAVDVHMQRCTCRSHVQQNAHGFKHIAGANDSNERNLSFRLKLR